MSVLIIKKLRYCYKLKNRSEVVCVRMHHFARTFGNQIAIIDKY